MGTSPAALANMSNFFSNLPASAAAELTTVLLQNPALRIERIASFRHASPHGFWYDQAHEEWVMLVRGTATLRWHDGASEDLVAGDFRLIAAGRRHRVEQTSHDALWLAVHFQAQDAKTPPPA